MFDHVHLFTHYAPTPQTHTPHNHTHTTPTSHTYIHHTPHKAQTGCSLFVLVTFCCAFMMSTACVDTATAAARKRQRRLRSWLRHKRMTVAMTLAEKLHHTSRGQKLARVGEEVVRAHLLRSLAILIQIFFSVFQWLCLSYILNSNRGSIQQPFSAIFHSVMLRFSVPISISFF